MHPMPTTACTTEEPTMSRLAQSVQALREVLEAEKTLAAPCSGLQAYRRAVALHLAMRDFSRLFSPR